VFHDARAAALRDALLAHPGTPRVAMNHFTVGELQSTLRRPWPGDARLERSRLALHALPLAHKQVHELAGLQLHWLAADAAPAATLPKCRDPNDMPLFALASAANASLLISRDKAVLKCRSYAMASSTARGTVITPEMAVMRLQA
jgi:hypothetical protein